MSLPQALPKQKCQPILASTPSQHCSTDFANPLVVVLVAREERQPGAEIFELQVLRAGGHEVLHFRVEDGRQREAEILRVLVVLEVDVPRQVRRARADGDLDRRLRVLGRDLVEIGQPDRSARHRAAVDDAAPVVEDFLALAALGTPTIEGCGSRAARSRRCARTCTSRTSR